MMWRRTGGQRWVHGSGRSSHALRTIVHLVCTLTSLAFARDDGHFRCTTFCEVRSAVSISIDASTYMVYNVLDESNRVRREPPPSCNPVEKIRSSAPYEEYCLPLPEDSIGTVSPDGSLQLLFSFWQAVCFWTARLELCADTLVITPSAPTASCYKRPGMLHVVHAWVHGVGNDVRWLRIKGREPAPLKSAATAARGKTAPTESCGCGQNLARQIVDSAWAVFRYPDIDEVLWASSMVRNRISIVEKTEKADGPMKFSSLTQSGTESNGRIGFTATGPSPILNVKAEYVAPRTLVLVPVVCQSTRTAVVYESQVVLELKGINPAQVDMYLGSHSGCPILSVPPVGPSAGNRCEFRGWWVRDTLN